MPAAPPPSPPLPPIDWAKTPMPPDPDVEIEPELVKLISPPALALPPPPPTLAMTPEALPPAPPWPPMDCKSTPCEVSPAVAIAPLLVTVIAPDAPAAPPEIGRAHV